MTGVWHMEKDFGACNQIRTQTGKNQPAKNIN